MRIMIRVFQFFLSIFAMIALYIFISYLFTLFPKEARNGMKTEHIYLYHNDDLLSHTEIIMEIAPFKERFLHAFADLLADNPSGYIAFSYGDRDFMMDKGGFDDLNTTLALRGLFINTPSLIRVGHYGAFSREKVVEVLLSKKMLSALVDSILKSFRVKDGKFVRYHDHFGRYYLYYYEAKEPYNLFHTCNTWTGDRLREAGVKMGRWTPFAENVISQLH